MLDQQHGDAALFLDVQDEARHVLGFLAVHAGHGFVQHQHLGPHGQGAGQFHALLQSVGQAGHRQVADVVNLEEIDHVALDLAAQRHLLALRRAAVPQRRQRVGVQLRVAAELDVVQHRHAAKQRHVLEGARQAQGGATVGADAGEIAPLQQHAPALGPVEARQGVEQAGLARAVGADHRRDLTRHDVQRHPGQRLDATKAQVHALGAQQRLRRGGAFARLGVNGRGGQGRHRVTGGWARRVGGLGLACNKRWGAFKPAARAPAMRSFPERPAN